MKATEHKETGEKMHIYEIGYLISPTIPEDKISEETSFIHGILQNAGGNVIAEEFPKMRPLTYTISKVSESKRSKFDDAYFGWVKFELPVAKISEIEKEINNREAVVRLILVKTVRENTLYGHKLAGIKRASEEAAKSGAVGTTEKKPASQEDIDKSIDALVIS